MSMKKSQFTTVLNVAAGRFLNIFGSNVDEKITKENFFSQIRSEIYSPFIYKTIALLQAADLEIDTDNPVYARVEETGFRLYKITSIAATTNDIAMTNGVVATYQPEGDKITNVTSVAQLRLTKPSYPNQQFNLLGHTTAGKGGGLFYYAGTVANTSSDNNGTIIVASVSGVFYQYVRLDQTNLNYYMFGAVGDGVTNDVTSCQSTLTIGAGKTVIAPSGATFKCNSTLTVPANTSIAGWGAKMDFSNSHMTGFDTSAGGCWIVGFLEIKGAGNASYNASGIGVNCAGTNNAPAAPTFVNGPVILHNIFRAWGGYGVYTKYCNRSNIEHNQFFNIGYAAYGGDSQNYSTFIDNYVEDVSPGSGGGDCYGAYFSRQNGTSETAEPRSYRCKANDNIINGVIAAAANNGHALDTHGGIEIEFSDNIISNCEAGIFLTSSTISAAEALAPKRCIASNNTLNLPYFNNYGILVRGAMNGATVVEYAEGNVVCQNTMIGGGTAGANTTGAISIQGTKGTQITIGSITQAAPFGVCLVTDNLDFSISGGTIKDCFDNSVTQSGGVAVRGNNNTGFMGGITFKYETAGLGTYVMATSILVSGGLTGIDIDLGRCSFEGIDATHLTFSDGVGINSESLYGYSKTENFNVTSGTGSTTKSVVFAKRFPSIPKVQLTNAGAISPGVKTMMMRTANITATGFDIILYPYDLTTWGATAAADINWRATT